MIYSFKFNIILGIAVRIALAILFLLFDKLDPFIREIHPNEVWYYQYPVRPNYVPGSVLWPIITISPFITFSIDFLLRKDFKDLIKATKAITLAYQINGLLTVIFKVVVGRPRPDFYYRCFPDGKGSDFSQCTGNRHSCMDGRKSFPSGHSSFAFTCMVFLSLYIARKLELHRVTVGQSWRLCLCILPLVISGCIAASRTCDYHHHYGDVIAGSMLGSAISYFIYNLYFPLPEGSTLIPNS